MIWSKTSHNGQDGPSHSSYRHTLQPKPPIEYSYGTIDLNAEPNADVGFDSQASYGFVYDDSKQSYTEEGYEEKPGASNVNWETKEVINDNHNHEPAQNLEGHPYVRRFTQEEEDLVENLTERHMDPRNILSSIKKHNPANVSIPRDVYNLQQKLKNKKKFGDTPMLVLENVLHSQRYVYYTREDPETNVVEDIFFCHPKSYCWWRAFPHVLIMDATYKTNQYRLPFIQIVGVTSTHQTFSIAHAFVSKEREENYVWVLEMAKSMLNKCMEPRVIITDRDLAVMNACRKVFPEAAKYLCKWHIDENIAKHCKASFSDADWKKFKAYTFITEMVAEMLHQEEVAQQGPPLDPETLALSQHEWLQFEPQSTVWTRCRQILRMSVPTPRCIDWGLLADAGEAVRARAVLGEDTPWTRLFDLADLPTYRLITVEFLFTFRYLAHQAAVREEDDESFLRISSSLYAASTSRCRSSGGGGGYEGLVVPGIRYALHRPPGTGLDDQRSTDPLHPPLHRDDHLRPCNLTRCFALYYASFYQRQEYGTLWGGAFVTHIARSRGMVGMLEDLPAIEPRKLDRRTVLSMKLAADIPGLGLRFIGLDGRPFQPAHVIVLPEQQQQEDGGPIPEPEPIREEPVLSPPREEEPPQHPPHVYRASRQSMRDGTQLPPFPEPRVYADDGSDAGPSGS
ncbi:hypothetical protein E3N88_21578 [Mikania micrantha]|uniref:MULE transposase domain-containing protein n=1 Tax=Mikania micrantha TaxID=192012 RepID=A0A5N6N9J8_9ASTR|nr:hypothetical protein E3N88_21578 [Mikania micrantha]